MAKRSIDIVLSGSNRTKGPLDQSRADLRKWRDEVTRISANVKAASKAGDEANAASQRAMLTGAKERAATTAAASEGRKALADRLAQFKALKAEAAAAGAAQTQAVGAVVKPAAAAKGALGGVRTAGLGAEKSVNTVKYALLGLTGSIPGLDQVATTLSSMGSAGWGLGIGAAAAVTSLTLLGGTIRQQLNLVREHNKAMREGAESARRFVAAMRGDAATTARGSGINLAIEQAKQELAAARAAMEAEGVKWAGTTLPKWVDQITIEPPVGPPVGINPDPAYQTRMMGWEEKIKAGEMQVNRLEAIANDERKAARRQLAHRLAMEVEGARIDGIADDNARRRAAMQLRHRQERIDWTESERTQPGSAGNWGLTAARQQQETANLEAEIARKAAGEAVEIQRGRNERLHSLQLAAAAARIEATATGHQRVLAMLKLQQDEELRDVTLTEQMKLAIRETYAARAASIERDEATRAAAAADAEAKRKAAGGNRPAGRPGAMESRTLMMQTRERRTASMTERNTRETVRAIGDLHKAIDRVMERMERTAGSTNAPRPQVVGF